MKFNELQIKQEIISALDEMGFSEMMPIQERVIPLILDGCDVIGQAQTGTGKTAAFGIPLIEKSNKKNQGVEHLIISPTRELATQIQKELELIAKGSGITIGLILGGVDYNKERRMLKSNPNIIVGTPGRLLDHITNKKLDLSNLLSLTLDEADEMLDIGFKEELNQIIESMPEERQSLLFSATLSEDVKKLANKMLKDPMEILVSTGLATATNVKQKALICEEEDKLVMLTRLLQIDQPQSAIIFGRTKRRADELSHALSKKGLLCRALHGDLTQKERNNVMIGFRNGVFPILVATDVASRGLDIDDVEVIYNRPIKRGDLGQALKENPDDEDARFNKEYLEKQLPPEEQQQNKQDQQQSRQNQQNQDDQSSAEQENQSDAEEQSDPEQEDQKEQQEKQAEQPVTPQPDDEAAQTQPQEVDENDREQSPFNQEEQQVLNRLRPDPYRVLRYRLQQQARKR